MIKSSGKTVSAILALMLLVAALPVGAMATTATTTNISEYEIPFVMGNKQLVPQSQRDGKDGVFKGSYYFYEKVAIFYKNIGNKLLYGLCDITGHEFVEAEKNNYSDISPFSEGLARVYSHSDVSGEMAKFTGYMNTSGEILAWSKKLKQTEIELYRNTYRLTYVGNFYNNLAPVAYTNIYREKAGEVYNGLSSVYRYINIKDGSFAFGSEIFNQAKEFSEGKAFVTKYIVPNKTEGDGKNTPYWATGDSLFIDTDNHELFKCSVDYGNYRFHDGFLYNSYRHKIFNENGTEITEFSKKLALGNAGSATHEGFNDGVINITSYVDENDNMTKEHYSYYYGKDAKLIYKTALKSFQTFSEGLLAVTMYGKVGYLNKNNEFEKRKPEYSYGYFFSEGLAYVEMPDGAYSKKAGFIDKNNNPVIPFDYVGISASTMSPYVNSFRNGYALMKKKDGQWVTIKNPIAKSSQEYQPKATWMEEALSDGQIIHSPMATGTIGNKGVKGFHDGKAWDFIASKGEPIYAVEDCEVKYMITFGYTEYRGNMVWHYVDFGNWAVATGNTVVITIAHLNGYPSNVAGIDVKSLFNDWFKEAKGKTFPVSPQIGGGSFTFTGLTLEENNPKGAFAEPDKKTDWDEKYIRIAKVVNVKKGDVIGYVGNTGGSDTAHLHVEFNYKGSYLQLNQIRFPNNIKVSQAGDSW